MATHFHASRIALTLVAALIFTGGCRRRATPATPRSNAIAATEPAPPWFDDVTEKSGLNFTHEVGPLGNYALPEIMGSGAALFDFDNDGRLDIYLVQNAGPMGPRNQLFHQEPGGTFRDVSAGSGLDVAGYGMGVAIGDVNNDGRPDVLLCEYGGIRLLLNNGDGTFTDVTREAGLADPPDIGPIRRWATAATFVDYDRDGRLDLVVASYLAYDPGRLCSDPKGRRDYCGPGDFPGSITRVYHNQAWDPGETGVRVPRFKDVTAEAGLAASPGPALGIVAADFDGDGWPDLLIANDGKPNRLWINHHDGTFTDQAVERGLAFDAAGQSQANMGIALGDVNGDGLFDLYITHLTDENNTLWVQGPRGLFADRTSTAGLVGHGQGTGFGTVLADFDLSGSPGLVVVNGRVTRAAQPLTEAQAPDLAPYWRAYAERNQLFSNDGHGHFHDISAANPAFCSAANVARGLAYGDIFSDGSVSLLLTTVAGPARLFRNTAVRRGHWLVVRAVDPALGGRDAYGATVSVIAGGRTFLGLVNPGSSYLCSNDPRPHFGLGANDQIDAIKVRWPDGSLESFTGGKADQFWILSKGSGTSKR